MQVGVLIRTLNEAALIGRCLETLQGQQGGFALDVLVLDSGSTDDTVAIARAHGARVDEIPPSEFDYSKSLNRGLEQLPADLVVILSAHAIPLDDRWLERMTAPFADERVAGVAGGQVPWPGAPWWEVRRLNAIFGEHPVRTEYRAGAHGVLFSNAASCVRRSVWREHAFTLPAAEDMEWAQRVVDAGWTVVFEPAATVYHSHDESPRAQALRMIDLNRADHPGPRTLRRTLREAAGLLYRNARAVIALDEPAGRRAAYLVDLAKMTVYYVLDFQRSGSTAERRRLT
jgi:rhamnosyltransferase